MTRHCAGCGRSYEALTARGRWCSERCRSKARRTGTAAPDDQPQRVPGGVTAATLAELGVDAGTVYGRLAINLALRIDNGASGHGLVALIREHRATMAAAAVRETGRADLVDELRKRRQRRRGRS